MAHLLLSLAVDLLLFLAVGPRLHLAILFPMLAKVRVHEESDRIVGKGETIGVEETMATGENGEKKPGKRDMIWVDEKSERRGMRGINETWKDWMEKDWTGKD
jgi:hypothetical protein